MVGSWLIVVQNLLGMGAGFPSTGSTGTALGVANATGIGHSLVKSVGTVAGAGNASGVGHCLSKSSGTVPGTSTANGFANGCIGSATATSSASAMGAGAITSTGSCTGEAFAGASGLMAVIRTIYLCADDNTEISIVGISNYMPTISQPIWFSPYETINLQVAMSPEQSIAGFTLQLNIRRKGIALLTVTDPVINDVLNGIFTFTITSEQTGALGTQPCYYDVWNTTDGEEAQLVPVGSLVIKPELWQ